MDDPRTLTITVHLDDKDHSVLLRNGLWRALLLLVATLTCLLIVASVGGLRIGLVALCEAICALMAGLPTGIAIGTRLATYYGLTHLSRIEAESLLGTVAKEPQR